MPFSHSFLEGLLIEQALTKTRSMLLLLALAFLEDARTGTDSKVGLQIELVSP